MRIVIIAIFVDDILLKGANEACIFTIGGPSSSTFCDMRPGVYFLRLCLLTNQATRLFLKGRLCMNLICFRKLDN